VRGCVVVIMECSSGGGQSEPVRWQMHAPDQLNVYGSLAEL